MKKIKVSIIGPGLEPIVHVSKVGLIIKIVVGVVGTAVVGGGVALVTQIWDPLWNPFRPEPEEVIEEMFAKMEAVQTMHSEIKIEINTIDEKLKQETQLSIAISDDSDAVDSESVGDIDIAVDFSGIQTSLAGEYKITEGVFFVKLNKIPIFPIPINLDTIKEQWIKLSEGLGREQRSTKERVINFFKEKEVYSIREELPDEKINGQEAYHYMLVLSKEDIKTLMEEFSEVDALSSQQSLGGQSIPPIGTPGEITEMIDEIEIEVWIGKKDKLLYKVKLYKEVDASKLNETAERKVTVDINIEFSNFNEPIEVTAPKESRTLEEILILMLSIPSF